MRLVMLCALLALFSVPLEAQKSKRRCTGTPVDTLAEGERVYQDCQVDRVAKQRGSGPRVEWNPSASSLSTSTCYRAAYEFVVDTAGVPDPLTIRRVSSTDARFADAVRNAVVGMRYDPAQLAGRPVRQLVLHESKAELRAVATSAPGSFGASSRPSNC